MGSEAQVESRDGVEGRGPCLSGSGERKHRQVSAVQEAPTCHHVGTPTTDTRGTKGILEGPNRIGILHGSSTAIGVCQGAVLVFHDDIIEGLSVIWSEWRLKYVLLTHAATMLYLQGATLQQVFSPFILLRASKRPDYHPVPGADDVVLAQCPPETLHIPLPKLFSILSAKTGA